MKKNEAGSFGLTEKDLDEIHGILSRYRDIEVVSIFGSRAKGTFNGGSDVDLAVMNKGVDDETIRKVKADFEESLLPYMMDLVNYPVLSHGGLREHIERVGKVIYRRGTESGNRRVEG